MSDQDTSLFQNGEAPAAEPGSSAPAPVDTGSDLLKVITNEAGEQKYKDVPTALQALVSSQQYIPQLHTKLDEKDNEIKTLREELIRSKAVEDIVDRLQAEPQAPAVQPTPGLDADSAAEMFENILDAREQKHARAQNTKAVTDALLEKFGEKAEEVFYGKGAELGLDKNALNDLAGTSPAAVLALFQTASKQTSVDVSQGTLISSVEQKEDDLRLGRNSGKSVLMGSTSADVKQEADYVKRLVNQLHNEGVAVEDLTDPKKFKQFFGPQG
jgi:hypothetical protein